MKSCCFGFKYVALLLVTTALNYSEITSLLILRGFRRCHQPPCFFLFFSPIQMLFLVSKYFIDAWNKAFPSWFCPVGQKLRLWFINTVNLTLRLLVLDPKCHRQVMQSADSVQMEFRFIWEFLIGSSRGLSAESGGVCIPTAAIKLAQKQHELHLICFGSFQGTGPCAHCCHRLNVWAGKARALQVGLTRSRASAWSETSSVTGNTTGGGVWGAISNVRHNLSMEQPLC